MMRPIPAWFCGLHPAIRWSLWCQACLFVLSLLAYPLDQRLVMGVNPWLKPIKFELSVSIFLATMGSLLAQCEQVDFQGNAGVVWRLAISAAAWMTGMAMIAENTLIAMQSARGVRSHMNYATLFDRSVFGVMAAGVVVNTLALVVLLILYLRPASHWQWPVAVIWAVRLGLAILVWGSFEGVAMVTRQQHTVGGPDSGGGLPLLNWSRTHGDLRVPHFFAVHAIQCLMLLGFLLSRSKLSQSIQSSVVVIAAVAYLYGCYWLFRQAVQGHPFF